MIKYSDVYVSILAKGLCHPGEQFVGSCSVRHLPFWAFGAPLFRHGYLLVATTHRLIALDHRRGFVFDRLDRADSWAWADLGAMKLSGVLSKKLVVKDRAGRTLLKGKVTGFLGPMANNGQSARALVQTWQQHAQLGAAPAMQALPHYAAA
ncbi:MAG TPA: hypothetical protein VGH28_21540 [Polyangiaceae bacterium]|jgi:hypothetical protein